jgi:cobalt-zinc-cadmium efflux system membrane fusion protein
MENHEFDEATPNEEIERKTDSPANKVKALLFGGTAVLLIIAVALFTFWRYRAAPDDKPTAETEKNEAGTVKFLMEQQWLIQMKLAKAEEQMVSRQITSVGRVVPAANSQALVSTPVAGILSYRPLPQIGQFISAGQPIAVVRQTATAAEEAQTRAAIAQADSQRIQTETQNSQAAIENARLEADRRDAAGDIETARVRLEAARREADRDRKLFESGVVSQKEMQTSKSESDSAQASYDAAVKRLAALNAVRVIPPRRVSSALTSGSLSGSSSFTVSAPFSGYVTKVSKAIGEQVSPGDAIIEISNLDTVYVEAPMFERDLNVLGGSKTATFTTSAYSQQFKGSVIDLGSTIDEQTRAAKVIFQVENAGRALRLGMQANVQLDAEQTVTAMMIPKEAVLETEGKRIVYVLISGEEFQRREVTVGDEYGEKIAILSGIENGERVVTQGAYQLRLQELRPADTGVHSHET